MRPEVKREDVKEIANILKELDTVSIMIIKSNASILLARQELAETRIRQQVESEYQV